MKSILLTLTLLTSLNTFAQDQTVVEPASVVVCEGMNAPLLVVIEKDAADAVTGAALLIFDENGQPAQGSSDLAVTNLVTDAASINIEGTIYDGAASLVVTSKDPQVMTYKDENGQDVSLNVFTGFMTVSVDQESFQAEVACYLE
jgi:hypothetical protein